MYAGNQIVKKAVVVGFIALAIVLITSVTISALPIIRSSSCFHSPIWGPPLYVYAHGLQPLLFIAYGQVSFLPFLAIKCTTYIGCGRIISPIFEFVFFVLTVVNYRAALKEGWAKGSVLEILARDGLLAFATILGKHVALKFLPLYIKLSKDDPTQLLC
jgi:hypothetical protein